MYLIIIIIFYHIHTAPSSPKMTDMVIGDAFKLSVTPRGTICLRLRDQVIVYMTIDSAVLITNAKKKITIAVSQSGAAAALIHPNGRVYRYGSRVEIKAIHQQGNNKYAKMSHRGVTFTAEQIPVVYILDEAGTRTTKDTFMDMSHNLTYNVFYNGSRHGPAYMNEALSLLHLAQYWQTYDGYENWIINDIHINQNADGHVRIESFNYKYKLRTSPSNGSTAITSPFLHCTASLGKNQHVFVKYGNKRMHFDGNVFTVRNAGRTAGFDDNNHLKVD